MINFIDLYQPPPFSDELELHYREVVSKLKENEDHAIRSLIDKCYHLGVDFKNCSEIKKVKPFYDEKEKYINKAEAYFDASNLQQALSFAQKAEHMLVLAYMEYRMKISVDAITNTEYLVCHLPESDDRGWARGRLDSVYERVSEAEELRDHHDVLDPSIRHCYYSKLDSSDSNVSAARRRISNIADGSRFIEYKKNIEKYKNKDSNKVGSIIKNGYYVNFIDGIMNIVNYIARLFN